MNATATVPLQRHATTAGGARVAGRALGAGQLRLLGRTPNGQRFRASPRRLWVIDESRARIGGVDLGVPGSLTPQAQLGDFLIPQRGLFVIGSAFFEPDGEGCRRPLTTSRGRSSRVDPSAERMSSGLS